MKDRKVGMGWNRRREQGNEAYPLRTDVGGVAADIEKSLLGLDSRAGTKKVGFREGGHDTHTDTQTYIYIYMQVQLQPGVIQLAARSCSWKGSRCFLASMWHMPSFDMA